MTFLPIVERELLVASRRHATYSTRLVVALVAIVIGIFLYIANLRTPKHLLAHYIFQGLSVLALFYCLAAGRRSTADCLSEEKREGTLGLLFLTELKGYDVVLGKLVATSLHSIYGLLAVLPLLALPLLMGGVTSGEFWRVTAVLLLTLYMTLSIGMVVSALTRETRQAMSTTLLIIVFLAAILPLCWWIQTVCFPGSQWDFLLWPSPGYLYMRAFDYFWRFGAGAVVFWNSFLTIFILASVAILTACLYLPQAWHEK